MIPDFEWIKQNGKIILSSTDNSSIPVIFRNLKGLNIKGEQYIRYLLNIAFAEIRFSPVIIEYSRNDILISINDSVKITEVVEN